MECKKNKDRTYPTQDISRSFKKKLYLKYRYIIVNSNFIMGGFSLFVSSCCFSGFTTHRNKRDGEKSGNGVIE